MVYASIVFNYIFDESVAVITVLYYSEALRVSQSFCKTTIFLCFIHNIIAICKEMGLI